MSLNRNSQSVELKFVAPENNIYFMCGGDNVETLRLSKDGFYVRGVKVADDTEIYTAFKLWLAQAQKDTAAQRSGTSGDAKDAARYRFLRSAYAGDVETWWWAYTSDPVDLSQLDAVIDAEIAKQSATEDDGK